MFPNICIVCPCDPVEARLAALYSLQAKTPVYTRLAKRGEPAIHSSAAFDITLPHVIREGADTAILFHGSISAEVMKAYDELVRNRIHPLLVSIPMVQPLQTEALIGLLRNTKHVVCVEKHFENSGLGSMVRRMAHEHRCSWSLTTMGIPYRFIHEVKHTEPMRKHFGIAADDIVRMVTKPRGGA